MPRPYGWLDKLLPVAATMTADFFNRFESRFAISHLKDVAATGAEVDTPAFGKGVFP